MSKKPKKKALSAGDAALWQEVAKTVKPLTDRPEGAALPPRRMVRRLDEERALPSEWQTGVSPDPSASIDKKTKRKITKGTQDVDRSIDLHGLTQDRAFRLLKSTIEGAIRRGDKTLLVVTGKGGVRFSQTGLDTPVAYRTRSEFDQFGGVLKRMVPVWLNGPELKPYIQSYDAAAKEHGGEGALYVLLRRKMPGSRRK